MESMGNAKRNLLAQKEQLNKYDQEYSEIDLNNSNDSHSIVIKELNACNKILDIGCGVGLIGKKIKEMRNCYIDGIELDPISCQKANKVYDHVYSFDLSDKKSCDKFFNRKDKYEAIILCDILEHLENPSELLALVSRNLEDNGFIIISIPNISHIDIIANLINGKFNYNTTGLLDSTHLRFFTESSFYDFIENININYNLTLDCQLVAKTYYKGDDSNDDFLFKELGIDAYVFQNIFKITLQGKKIRHPINDNHYKKINDKYQELIATIKKLTSEKQNDEEEIKQNIATIQKLEKMYKEKEIEVNNVYNSKSWKITSPLRKISSKVSKKG